MLDTYRNYLDTLSRQLDAGQTVKVYMFLYFYMKLVPTIPFNTRPFFFVFQSCVSFRAAQLG